MKVSEFRKKCQIETSGEINNKKKVIQMFRNI